MSDIAVPTTEALPVVLFLCVHNAGRSQMALGWFDHLAVGRAVARSGGSEPAKVVNPAAVAAMAEIGIDISRQIPKRWTAEIVGAADVVVTMGCGDACPVFPGKRYEDWVLADPFGRALEEVPTERLGRRTAVAGRAGRLASGGQGASSTRVNIHPVAATTVVARAKPARTSLR